MHDVWRCDLWWMIRPLENCWSAYTRPSPFACWLAWLEQDSEDLSRDLALEKERLQSSNAEKSELQTLHAKGQWVHPVSFTRTRTRYYNRTTRMIDTFGVNRYATSAFYWSAGGVIISGDRLKKTRSELSFPHCWCFASFTIIQWHSGVVSRLCASTEWSWSRSRGSGTQLERLREPFR